MRTRLLFLASMAVVNQLPAQGESASPSVAATVPESVNSVAKSKDTLSVDFPDEEIRTILRNVADLFELNLVIPDKLQGRTSLKLREVTWRQIFQVVLSPVGYSFIEDGNIIKIVSRDAMLSEPFITDSVVLENVAASSIQPLLSSILTPPRPASGTEPAVPGGTIVLNSLANELIITDQAVTVARAIATAKRLDSEPRQVVIETKFVELTKDDRDALGVRFAGKKDVGGGSAQGAGALNTLGQSLPTGGVPLTGSFNAVLDSKDYAILLQAVDSISGTRIVSNPTIVAINGSKSLITIGTDFQLVTATQTAPTGGGTPTVTFTAGEKIFEGVRVEVTPQITSNKLVSLALKTEKSDAKPFTVGSGGSVQTFYDINKREGSLNMILKDGQTAAIGGLMDTKNTQVTNKVPVLGDIPVLGYLFKEKSNQKVETNLIIFITASILEPSKTTYRNVATQAQINALDITRRDIEGVTYQVSPEEASLYSGVNDIRKLKQDAEINAKLEREKAVKAEALSGK